MLEKSQVAEKHQKRINTDQVIGYLNHAFGKAVQKANLGSKNQKGTKLYEYQVDFSYLIDGIGRSPNYIVPKLITEANELIDKINSDSE